MVDQIAWVKKTAKLTLFVDGSRKEINSVNPKVHFPHYVLFSVKKYRREQRSVTPFSDAEFGGLVNM